MQRSQVAWGGHGLAPFRKRQDSDCHRCIRIAGMQVVNGILCALHGTAWLLWQGGTDGHHRDTCCRHSRGYAFKYGDLYLSHVHHKNARVMGLWWPCLWPNPQAAVSERTVDRRRSRESWGTALT